MGGSARWVGIVFVALALAGTYALMQRQRDRLEQAIAEAEGEPALPTPPLPVDGGPDGIEALDRLLTDQPERAVSLCTSLLEKEQDPMGRARLERRLVRARARAFRKLSQQGRHAEAEAIARPLLQSEVSLFEPEAHEVRIRWADFLGSLWEKGKAEGLLLEALRDARRVAFAQIVRRLEAHGQDALAQWSEALARGDREPARKHLRRAAAALAHRSDLLAEPLAKAFPLSRLLEQAQQHLADEPALALAYATAAQRSASARGGRSSAPESERASALITDGTLALSRRVRNGDEPWVHPSVAIDLLDRIRAPVRRGPASSTDRARAPLQLTVSREKLAMDSEVARRLRRMGLFDDARDAADRALRQRSAELFESESQSATEAARARAGLIRKGEAQVTYPEALPAKLALPAIDAGRGLLRWRSLNTREREAGEDILRTVLRENPVGEIANTIDDEVRSALLEASAENDFDALLRLSSFAIAELPPPSTGDAFGRHLRDGLSRAADFFRGREQMKYLFVRTLEADFFANEASGQKAGAEAVALAFELVSERSAEPMRATGPSAASGLPGLSVVAVDNATRYPLLAFYEGPERFFVRIHPVRRGTVVLKDGAYRVVVIVAAEDVLPHHGRAELKSQLTRAAYSIRRQENGQETAVEAAPPSGPYRLARAPEGMRELEIDGESGAARLTKP